MLGHPLAIERDAAQPTCRVQLKRLSPACPRVNHLCKVPALALAPRSSAA